MEKFRPDWLDITQHWLAQNSSTDTFNFQYVSAASVIMWIISCIYAHHGDAIIDLFSSRLSSDHNASLQYIIDPRWCEG